MKQSNQQTSYNNSKKYCLCRKKFVAILVASSTLLTGITVYHTRKINQQVNSNSKYEVGYNHINLLTNGITNKVTKDNFIILDIGDHNSGGTLFQKQKLDYCTKNQIDIGLLVNSNSTTLGDVYLDLEYVKELMKDYLITYPVYINVDSFFDNENLTYNDALELVNVFLTKASDNNFFVGVYGKNENIGNDFELYEKLIIDNKEQVVSRKLDNIYYIDKEIKEVIQEKKLNDSHLFKEDGYYVVNESDTFKSIAKEHSISVSDLKKYNPEVKNLESGLILRIPSEVQSTSSKLIYDYPIKTGIDVSLWQDVIDWNEVDVDYAIIQIRDFSNKESDPQFLNNVAGCIENKIPMGFYVFSRATSISELKKEAEYVIKELKDIDVTYPIYLDLETDYWQKIPEGQMYLSQEESEEVTDEKISDFIQTWEREIRKSGYIPGIYCNESIYQKLQQVMGNNINNLALWIANGEYYDQVIDYDVKETLPVVPSMDKVGMLQISQKGQVNGINTNTDIDYCYTDYETGIYHFEANKFPKYVNKVKEYGIITTGTLVIFGGIYLKVSLRKKKGKKRVKDINQSF